jgi:alkylhydroperoxidase/carboxymuconolactone decarboxylase family protein YurZ
MRDTTIESLRSLAWIASLAAGGSERKFAVTSLGALEMALEADCEWSVRLAEVTAAPAQGPAWLA